MCGWKHTIIRYPVVRKVARLLCGLGATYAKLGNRRLSKELLISDWKREVSLVLDWRQSVRLEERWLVTCLHVYIYDFSSYWGGLSSCIARQKEFRLAIDRQADYWAVNGHVLTPRVHNRNRLS